MRKAHSSLHSQPVGWVERNRAEIADPPDISSNQAPSDSGQRSVKRRFLTIHPALESAKFGESVTYTLFADT